MTTTIDFDALQVSEGGPVVTLLANRNVGGGLVGGDFADFSAFSSLSVDVKVQRMSSTSPPPLLTVLVEHSDDGLSWSTGETFTFTDDGEQTASLASPKAHVRASASGSGAEWYVKSVDVAPIAGGGGGSTPGIPLEDPGTVWAPSTVVASGYQIANTHAGALHVFETTTSGTTADWPADFDELDPDYGLGAITTSDDVLWKHLGIVDQISYQFVPVYEAAYYSSTLVSVDDGASTTLPWNILDSGTAMFDLTTPTHPVVLKAGLFIVCAQVAADSLLSPGGSITADLILDYGNDNAENFNQGLAGPDQASVVVMASYVLAAGAQIRLYANNNDGVSARGLNIKNATVVRIGPA